MFYFLSKPVEQQLPKGLSWVKTNIKNIPKNAFIGGWEDGGKRNVYIGRAEQHGCLITGNVIQFWGGMFYPLGHEHKAESFEVLVADDLILLKWVPAKGSNVPKGAIQGGFQGEDPLFIARGQNPADEPTPGKLHPPHGFFLSWGGREHHPYEYEALVCEGISDAEYTPGDERMTHLQRKDQTVTMLFIVPGRGGTIRRKPMSRQDRPPQTAVSTWRLFGTEVKGSIQQDLPKEASWMNTDIRIIPDNAFVGGLKDGGKRDVYIVQQQLPKGISWVKTNIKNIPKNAFIGGWEDGGKRNVYIGRAEQHGCLITGKVIQFWGGMFYPLGHEHKAESFEVLVADDLNLLKWVPAKGSNVPKGAIQGGFQGKDPLFIARGQNPAGEPTPGKLHPPHGFFLSWGGGEHHPYEYEVLVCEGISDAEYTPADERVKGSIQQELPKGASWMNTDINSIPDNAFVGGFEDGGKRDVYIGRAEYFGNFIPGKAIPFWNGMFFPLLGKEVRNQTFEVLVTDNPGVFRWVPASSGQVPQGAVQGGYQDGAPIYIARGKNPAGEPTPGKLHPPYGFFLSWGGKEHHRQEYEVLVCDGISDAPYAGQGQKASAISAVKTPDAPPDYMQSMVEISLEKLEKLDKLDNIVRLLEKIDSRLDNMDNKMDKLEERISKLE